MNEADVRAWVAMALIAMGVVFYVLFDAWAPSQVVMGPVVLGSSAGDCHGLKAAETVFLELCK